MKGNRVLVLRATQMELAPAQGWLEAIAPGTVVVETVGVGPYHAAFQVARLVALHRPDVVVLVGIAGAYPEAGIVPGETFLVCEERAADLGAFRQTGFEHTFEERIICPYLFEIHGFDLAVSNSVSVAAAPFVSREGVQIENMEGIAFFYACQQMGVPFLELRTVSNLVGEPFQAWDLPLATKNLSVALKQLLHEIIA